MIKASGKNVEKRQDRLWCRVSDEQHYELEVDEGYFYAPMQLEDILNICLQPEENGHGEIVFEILKNTMPAKLHAVINGRQFTVDLR